MGPSDVLLEIGAAEAGSKPYRGVISLREHESRSHILPRDLSGIKVRELLSLLKPAILAKLIDVRIEVDSAQGAHICIASKSYVGFASCGTASDRLFVRVVPKVGTKRMLELAAAAEWLPVWRPDVFVDSDERSTLLDWAISALIYAVEKLISTGGVRSTHERSIDELRSRVRGRVLVAPFLRSVSRGRPDRIPCQFSALSLDNSQNRLLRWAIYLASRASEALPSRSSYQAAIKRIDLSFSEVPLVPPSPGYERELLCLPPNLRHYEHAMRLAFTIIKNMQLTASPGVAAAPASSFDMNALYEEAFFKTSKKIKSGLQQTPAWRLNFWWRGENALAKTLRLEPDMFLGPDVNGCCVIVDTKWKRAYESDEQSEVNDLETALVRPRTSDVYQVGFYALEALRSGRASKGCLCVLVYPCLTEQKIAIHELSGSYGTIKIALIGWNLERRESIQHLWGQIELMRASEVITGESAKSM